MQSLERAFLRTLRQAFDTELQLQSSLKNISRELKDAEIESTIDRFVLQSGLQVERLAGVFKALYLEPRGEASWVATALLREAWDMASSGNESIEGFAASLLALKRHELTQHELLVRWSHRCCLDEVLPGLRRNIAEKLLQAAILTELASEERVLPSRGRAYVHQCTTLQ